MRCLSALEICGCSLHSLDHCSFIDFLMCCIRADFNDLYLKGRFVLGSNAVFFASVSARLFSLISECLGIHVIMICYCGFAVVTSSMRSRKSLIIACPDCLRGLLIAFMAT